MEDAKQEEIVELLEQARKEMMEGQLADASRLVTSAHGMVSDVEGAENAMYRMENIYKYIDDQLCWRAVEQIEYLINDLV